MAMTNAQRQARWRERRQERYVTALAGDDFALFARAASVILKELRKAQDTRGRKQELRNAVSWLIMILGILIKEWPHMPRDERERLANVRNTTQMFAFGGCDETCAMARDDMLKGIARNPNWEGPRPTVGG